MTSTDRRAGVGAASKLWRLLATVGVFGVVGPPVGGLVTWLTMGWATMGASALRSPIPFLTGSYGEGLVLALAAGLLVGVATLWFGSESWFVPIAVVAIVSIALLATTVIAGPPDLAAATIRVARVFLPASLIATIACWLLTRRLLKP